MRQPRDPMANVLRRTWTERIDDRAFAAIAEFSETNRGYVFSASTFLLGESGTWMHRRAAREKVEQKLSEELRRGDHIVWTSLGGYYHHRFGMPCMGKIQDLNRH